ncbi:MAG: ROK family protein [Deltaproteobacteria bacterium]|nr:ROK family protein [Deltaproteobacteria bacterium]MBW2086791.1 ROK family protein [Deltaproteobacteria bacterium]
MTNYLGVDIGGTNIRYGLVSAQGRLWSSGHFPAQIQRGFDQVVADLNGRLKEFMATLPSSAQPQGVGIGVAGRIAPQKGLVVFSPNLPDWKNAPLAERVWQALDLEVRIENDANLYALGEWLAGAGQGLDNLIVLTLGTGVGGGLILNGRLWTGSFGNAAEVGHMVVEPEGRTCNCGGRGCLETLASAAAMARMAREWIEQGETCGYRGRIEDLTSAHLFDLARQGDTLALKVFDRAGSALGLVLTDIFNLLGLQGAIIGGGAAAAFEFLKPRIKAELSARLMTSDPDQILLARSALGDQASLIGVPTLFRASKEP